MKVALIHDYLKEYGGAERVVEALHEIFPKAPLYTAYWDHKMLKGWDIRTSFLQKIPFAGKLISPFRIIAPMIFESFDLSEYDLIISSCNTYFAKAVITKPEALHISYIHTPPRYLYGYTTSFNYKKHWWTRILGELANHILRIYDFETSQRPDILVANSKNVAERIKKFYRRDAVVIYPPVDIDKFQNKKTRNYFLSVSRLVRGKGIDVIVEAATKLNISLKVIGIGPERDCLEQTAGKNVEFLGQVDDKELAEYYSNAKALIVASEDEDFGITSVEAQASGIPVIAPASGGYLETVIDEETGILYGGFGAVNLQDLVNALQKFDESKFDSEVCCKNAENFSKDRFKKEILELVEKNIKK